MSKVQNPLSCHLCHSRMAPPWPRIYLLLLGLSHFSSSHF